MGSIIYYSLRSLSPYQGTIQVVETDGFRALSRDGETWRIRLRSSKGRRAVHVTWREQDVDLIEIEQAQAGFELRGVADSPELTSDRCVLSLTRRGRRSSEPAKTTPSALSTRNGMVPCSPNTHKTASAMLLLPTPLGPTIAVIPGPNSSSVLSAKVLNPRIWSFSKCTLLPLLLRF